MQGDCFGTIVPRNDKEEEPRNDKKEGPRNDKKKRTRHDDASRHCAPNHMKEDTYLHTALFRCILSLTSFSLGYYKLLRLLSDSYQVLGDRGSN